MLNEYNKLSARKYRAGYGCKSFQKLFSKCVHNMNKHKISQVLSNLITKPRNSTDSNILDSNQNILSGMGVFTIAFSSCSRSIPQILMVCQLSPTPTSKLRRIFEYIWFKLNGRNYIKFKKCQFLDVAGNLRWSSWFAQIPYYEDMSELYFFKCPSEWFIS